MDKLDIARVGRDPRVVETLRDMGGYLWYYTELYPYRTIYTLTVCKNVLCVYIAGEDMMDLKMPLEEYLRFEDDERRLEQLERSLTMLLNHVEQRP